MRMFKLRGLLAKGLYDGQAHLQILPCVKSLTYSRIATAAGIARVSYLKGGSFTSAQQVVPLQSTFRISLLSRRNNQLRRFLPSETRMACSSSSSSSGNPPPQNRLAAEKSPYLLQHATNPVNWYPWGEEAFQRAKAENKPIFLSVGYSTCHWCHVMERESFQDPNIGRMLNQHFIPIKVDREERPDVDRVYMTFVQATSGGGGWPMSVWLTPDLRPILGGTYFPPDDRYYGRPGFMTVCQAVAQKWTSQQNELEESGTLILDALMRGTSSATSQCAGEFPAVEVANKCYDMLSKSYDEVYGGFGKAPKFPQPVNFQFLGYYHHSQLGKEERREGVRMVVHTLKMMAKGGIHDHIAQGFHRYSTDRFWHVPHFEKMLYDQAQLAVAYLDAYQLTKDPVLADTARDIFEYVNRDLSHKEGGFFSAEDADSLPDASSRKKREGAFCVWTYEEIQELFKDRVAREKGGNEQHDVTYGDVFCHHYGVKEDGNVDPITDPHEELKKQNVLIVKGGVGDTAAEFGIPLETAENILAECRKVLFEKRLKRPKPHLDDKMISAWNGLMISGFARGGQVLQDPSLTARALSAAKFLREHMYNLDKGILLRSCYNSKEHGVEQVIQPIAGFVDDYAFVVQGLLDLYEATFEPCWLQWAEQLQQKQHELFWDADHGGYFSTVASDPSIVLRMKDDQDGAEPSANSVSALNLLRLSAMLNQPELREHGLRILSIFQKRLTDIPLALPAMVTAGILSLSSSTQIIIVGSPEEDGVRRMLREVHSHFLPNKVLLLADGSRDNFLYQRLPLLQSLERLEGKATAYVCQDFACSLPTNSVLELAKLLSKEDSSSSSSSSSS